MKLTIIIPLFNENKTILELLERIEEQSYVEKQIIIVNDASTDNSLKLINSFNFFSENLILSHEINSGKGACIKTAKNHIKGDIVIIQDADLEYNPSDYQKLIEPIVNQNFNVVYGSRVLGKNRYLNKNFTSIIRIIANHFLTFVSNVINNQKLTDAHTCYKVCRTDVFKKVNLKENDFSFCPELTTKLSNLKERILEIPINYNGRTYLEGKKIKSKDGIKALYTIFRYAFFK